MKHRNKQSERFETQAIDQQRRRLLLGAAAGSGAAVLAALGVMRGAGAAGHGSPAQGKMVRIVAFDDRGERLGEREVPMVVKTAGQWKQQLSPEAYQITRERGTEPPFSGKYYNQPDKPGIYRCVCCNTALYDAATQFHSGTGWPSFYQPIAEENVTRHTDHRLGMNRTEIRCTRCQAHLGHVFHDGPKPTGLRYCMDSVALRFQATGKA